MIGAMPETPAPAMDCLEPVLELDGERLDAGAAVALGLDFAGHHVAPVFSGGEFPPSDEA